MIYFLFILAVTKTEIHILLHVLSMFHVKHFCLQSQLITVEVNCYRLLSAVIGRQVLTVKLFDCHSRARDGQKL